MKRLLPLLAALLPLVCACDKQTAESRPEVAIENIVVSPDAVSFDLAAKNADIVAYTVLRAAEDVPDVSSLLAGGDTAAPGTNCLKSGLKPSTDYIIYAVASNSQTGACSIPATAEVTTEKYRHFKIELAIANYYAIGIRSITADNSEKDFTFFLLSDNVLKEEYGDMDFEDLGRAFAEKNGIESLTFSMYKGIMAPVWYSNITLWYNGLIPDSDYHLCLLYLNQDGTEISDTEVTTIHTPPIPERSAIEMSLTEFETDQTNAYLTFATNFDYSSIPGDTLPLVYFEPYSGIYFWKASIFDEGMSDMEMAQRVLDYTQETFGVTLGVDFYLPDGIPITMEFESRCIPDYTPGEDYYIVVFGTYLGRITTEPIVRRFTVPSADESISIRSMPSAILRTHENTGILQPSIRIQG